MGLVPGGVRQLVSEGHRVFVESEAGKGVGLEDEDYTKAGALVEATSEEVFSKAQMIIKVKEPMPSEVALLRPHHILYTFLHLAADVDLVRGLLDSGATCVAYETIQEKDLSLPLLTPMSEVAGRMAAQVGAHYLQFGHGGKGILLGGVPGTRRAKVAVIGAGIAGTNAIKMALGLGAQVVAIDLSSKRLMEIDDLFGGRVTTLFSNPQNIEESVVQADLVIGAVLIPGALAPKLVTRKMIARMEKGSVIVDIAVDQGGSVETARPTTHENPTFIVDDVIHYCVSNIPGAVPQTSTYALNNVTLKYASRMASLGVEKAAREDRALKKGVNIVGGKLVYKQVAQDLHLPYSEWE